jgi:hypothetical protein
VGHRPSAALLHRTACADGSTPGWPSRQRRHRVSAAPTRRPGRSQR